MWLHVIVKFLICSEADLDQTSSDTSQPTLLVCTQCKHSIGTLDEPASGWRIWKWCVHAASTSQSEDKLSTDTFNVQKWISARLIFLIENQGVQKFHVHPDIDSSSTETLPSLLIWVFTPDLMFSSSLQPGTRHDPTRAIKIFFEEKSYDVAKPGEPESANVEDVALPKILFEELGLALRNSQKLLPLNARTFKHWNVGLLERFEPQEVGQGNSD